MLMLHYQGWHHHAWSSFLSPGRRDWNCHSKYSFALVPCIIDAGSSNIILQRSVWKGNDKAAEDKVFKTLKLGCQCS
jgi:hypothetical protein